MSNISNFGITKSGSAVQRIRLRKGGMTADVLTYGAALQNLWIDGHRRSVVLGLSDIDAYQKSTGYFGAIVGRCANRIRNGRFEIDGRAYQVDQNFLGRHMLHGGTMGSDKLVWTVTDMHPDWVKLALNLPDGHMGFLGNLSVTATYRVLSQNELELQIAARCDAPTLCNFAPHNYFNLNGAATVKDHILTINAGHYLPVDSELIPTGEIRPVDDSVFDFRKGFRIGDFEYDHNFCVSNQPHELSEICQLSDAQRSVRMSILSTEPGLQVYSGASLDTATQNLSSENQSSCFAAVALEPQNWPDSINHGDFPNSVISPRDEYMTTTQYSFTC